MDIVARLEGRDQLERVLYGMRQRAGDLTDLMDRLGLVIETQTSERFDAETAPDGSKWTPSRRASEQGGKTLTMTARGRNSVTHRASADRVEVGTNVGYMAAHQTGATIRPRNASALAFMLPGVGMVFAQKVTLPRREWLGLSADNADELVDEAGDWFTEMFPELEA
jgi:phage gpG-like protein